MGEYGLDELALFIAIVAGGIGVIVGVVLAFRRFKGECTALKIAKMDTEEKIKNDEAYEKKMKATGQTIWIAKKPSLIKVVRSPIFKENWRLQRRFIGRRN